VGGLWVVCGLFDGGWWYLVAWNYVLLFFLNEILQLFDIFLVLLPVDTLVESGIFY